MRKLAGLIQFIRNFRYYRRNGYNLKSAWFFATMTIP